ncbi:MAG: pseudaminic acid cytidylyltransferase [Lachnospiraceae bacterium]|nr:pseudaminic acid cytidylyltransferase [Lachnospiraceae bacterium]
MSRSVAIITARGGSKRIPHKNMKNFCGKPIICYSIEAAFASGAFDEVMVSTDDDAIAEIAEKAGAAVPFRRSNETAGDYASTDDVIKEVLETYEKLGKHFDRFCCIYPTAPFLTPKKLCTAMDMLDQHDSVMPVVSFSYPPQRCLVLNQGCLTYKWPEYSCTRSQDLEPYYHDCGQFYACKTDPFLEAGTTSVPDLVPMLLSEMEVQDIDTQDDWEIAELKYQIMLRKKQL